jgi:hypothetical protein
MSGDWTLLSKAAAALITTREDRETWQVLSAKARNRLPLTEAERDDLAELNHQLGAVVRFKYREGKWQFGCLESDKTTFSLLPDIWRSLPVHVDPYGASITWDGKTFFPVLVRDAKAGGKRAGHKQVSKEAIQKWIIANKEEDWTYSQTVKAAVAGTGCTRECAQQALAKVPNRRGRGQHVRRETRNPTET